MASIVNVNGNTFEERNGKLYLNGREIKENIVHKSQKGPYLLIGFGAGMAFWSGLSLLASAI